MSFDYEIWCVDCQVGSGLTDRGADAVRDWLRWRAPLEAFGVAQAAGLLHELRVMHWTGNDLAPTEFFAKHIRHELKLRGEDGAFDDSCGEWFKCTCCNRSSVCVLPEGHPPPHSTKRWP